jgi:hypothetical protein
MGVAIVIFTGLFMFDNQEFFKTVEKNIEDGMSWHYVGKQAPGDNPAITIKDAQDNDVIYFRMDK